MTYVKSTMQISIYLTFLFKKIFILLTENVISDFKKMQLNYYYYLIIFLSELAEKYAKVL